MIMVGNLLAKALEISYLVFHQHSMTFLDALLGLLSILKEMRSH